MAGVTEPPDWLFSALGVVARNPSNLVVYSVRGVDGPFTLAPPLSYWDRALLVECRRGKQAPHFEPADVWVFDHGASGFVVQGIGWSLNRTRIANGENSPTDAAFRVLGNGQEAVLPRLPVIDLDAAAPVPAPDPATSPADLAAAVERAEEALDWPK